MKFNKNTDAESRGFTLIETLIAISILLVAVVGPMSLIGDATHKLYYSKDEMIALNLAQEGIEIVRSVRDSNTLAGAVWNTGLAAGSYIVDPSSTPLTLCVACDQKVYFGSNGSLYRQGTGFASTTQFSRLVTISTVAANADELKVASTVTWTTGGSAGSITASEDIFKWTP